MKINIWSDVRCPFCYIGKRKFERALERFPHKEQVEVVWRSFQLDPGLKTDPDLHAYDYLAKVKGLHRDQVIQMHDHVRKAAADVGLEFDFDHAVVANSFNAHRLIQFAKEQGMGSQAEERLFKAYFTEGKNIDDRQTLIQLGTELQLDPHELERMLDSDKYSDKVEEDEEMARSIGIRGVPFFIINDAVAVSGAQSPALFLQALEQAWEESRKTSVTG
jgi:protein disulfide-isomerase